MWFGRGSDVVRMWVGRSWLGCVFGSGADSLAEVKGELVSSSYKEQGKTQQDPTTGLITGIDVRWTKITVKPGKNTQMDKRLVATSRVIGVNL